MFKFLYRHPITGCGLVLGSLINVGSRLNDAYSLFNAGLSHQVWEAIGAAIFFLSVIALLYRWSNEKQGETGNQGRGGSTLAASGPNHSPLAEITATPTAPIARLRLLMRPQQDPEELTNENVYRWFAFRTGSKNPETGLVTHIGTYVFLVFRIPVVPSYKRVFSSTHPSLRLEAIDTTSRSMVVIMDDDPTGATLEMILSEKPI